jgi:2-iminobutanoate/2-iminopropanoate deaminase
LSNCFASVITDAWKTDTQPGQAGIEDRRLKIEDLKKGDPMTREIVNPLNKPTPVLSPAVKIDNLVYTAGQVGVNPETGELAGSGIQEQTKQVMENIKLLLEAAGSSMEKIIKCLVFITDMKDFQAMNEVYKSYFEKDPPARSCVEVTALANPELIVEIEAIAMI